MEDESEANAYKEEALAGDDKAKVKESKADEGTAPKAELVKEVEMNGHGKKSKEEEAEERNEAGVAGDKTGEAGEESNSDDAEEEDGEA